MTEKQFVSNTGDDLDVIGVAFDAGMACVHVLFIRQGKVLGSRSYFPKVPGGTELGEVVETFVGQFYLQGSQMRTLPGRFCSTLTLGIRRCWPTRCRKLAGRRINVQTKPRGDRARYLAGADQRRDGVNDQIVSAIDHSSAFAGAGQRTGAAGRQADGVF